MHTDYWHLETLGRLVAADPTVLASTDVRMVELEAPQNCAEAVTWWLERMEVGNEGMVIKPADFIRRCRRGLLQPGIKCRGREYLRILCGPDYTRPDHLESLHSVSKAYRASSPANPCVASTSASLACWP